MWVAMKVSSLTVDPFTNMPIVVLQEPEGRQAVPIWIGMIEASAIATELEQIRLDRPMTHDLMKTLLAQAGVKVDKVEIHDLRHHTFYATVYLTRADGSSFASDARPSDAIALALRTGAPILVAQRVIDRAKRLDLRLPGEDGVGAAELAAERLEALSDQAFGKWKM